MLCVSTHVVHAFEAVTPCVSCRFLDNADTSAAAARRSGSGSQLRPHAWCCSAATALWSARPLIPCVTRVVQSSPCSPAVMACGHPQPVDGVLGAQALRSGQLQFLKESV